MKINHLIIIIFVACLPFAANGQRTKTQAKRSAKKTQVVQQKSEIELVKDSAEVWFKTVYADKNLYDPYSYRLMNIKAEPVKMRQYLEREIEKYKSIMDTCYVQGTEEDLQKWKDALEQTQRKMDACSDDYSEYGRKKYAIFEESYNAYLEGMKSLQIYLLTKEYLEKMEHDLNATPDVTLDKIMFYDIYLDCYSKNNIGNEVLGRYKFPFSIVGPLGNQNGLDTVEKLN